MKLLLHTCCGPCFLGSYEGLKDKGFEMHNYFFNPNIQPKKEHELRVKNLELAARGKSKEIIAGEYDPKEHLGAVSSLRGLNPREGSTLTEDVKKERCQVCYRLRLTKTAQKAKEEKIELFSTTLLVSPYQQHGALREIGAKIASEIGVEFYYQDFRPYFRKGQSLAREMEIYRQKYCGCLYSKSD